MTQKAENPEPQSYSVAETAAAIGESKYRVRQMTEDGTLAAFSCGGNCRIPVAAVEAYLHKDDVPDAPDEPGVAPAPSPIEERVKRLYGEDRLFLSVEETTEVLEQFSITIIRNAIRRGQIPSRRIGGRRWVLVTDLAGWLRGQAA